MESETSQTKVTVSNNRLDVYKRRPDTLKKGVSWSKTLSATRFAGNTITQNQNIIQFLRAWN